MSFRTIVLATDFSPAAREAESLAGELARQAGATLHLVHVLPLLFSPGEAAQRLATVEGAVGPGLKRVTALLFGSAARAIVTYARDQGADLIVVGTHGRTGVSRVLMGSVAEAVARLAPCPVLTVPASAEGAATETPKEAAARTAAETPASRRCAVCAGETEDLICETCRARIRGEALEQKRDAERSGRRGSPA
jgi:nucleotide-binding universal stress UspA family protein